MAITPAIDGGEPFPLRKMRILSEALWNKEDGTIGKDCVPPSIHWQRHGDTFEAMTLMPSVDASASGHWHGFITNGEIR